MRRGLAHFGSFPWIEKTLVNNDGNGTDICIDSPLHSVVDGMVSFVGTSPRIMFLLRTFLWSPGPEDPSAHSQIVNTGREKSCKTRCVF